MSSASRIDWFIQRWLAMVVAAALLLTPRPVRADTIYWSEYTSGFGAIYSLDVASGKVATLITGTGSGPGGNNIDFPIALTVGPDANIYVGNANNGDIVKVTPAGVASNYFAVADPTHYPHTYGLAFNPSGNLYLAKFGQGYVSVLPPGGTDSVLASGLDHPQGGVVDPSGNYYVYTGETFAGATAIKISENGATSTFATGITALFWDNAGNLYTGTGSGTITLTTPSGVISTLATGLTSPGPLGLDANGDLYVWEAHSKNVFDLISPDGRITPIGAAPNGLATVVAIPEPNSVVALAFGAVAFLLRRNRRR